MLGPDNITHNAADSLVLIQAERAGSAAFYAWDLAQECLNVPSNISKTAKPYANVVRDLQAKPDLIGEWYQQLASSHLPTGFTKLVRNAIELTLAMPDASAIELADRLPLNDLEVPKVLRNEFIPSDRFTYLDVAEGITRMYEGLSLICPNLITTDTAERPPSWPFMLGVPMGRFGALRELVNQTFLGTHPLLVTDVHLKNHEYDGIRKQTALAALMHDDDHLAEQADWLMERATRAIGAMGLLAPRLHRNFVIPMAMIDICFKSLVLEYADRRKQGMTPTQRSLVDAFLFASHEEENDLLPPALLSPAHHGNSIDPQSRAEMFADYVDRWSDPADLYFHFAQLPRPLEITRNDCIVALQAIGQSAGIASVLLKNSEEHKRRGYSRPIQKLLEVAAPSFIAQVVRPDLFKTWNSGIDDMITSAQELLKVENGPIITVIANLD